MTVFPETASVRVRNVRCLSPSGERQSVHAAVQRLDPSTGLKPGATLLIRRIEGSLLGDPPRVEDVDLRDIARRAARPAQRPTARGCAAVVFDDPVDLLACLARDIASSAPLAWWWSLLLLGQTNGPAITAEIASARGLARYVRALPPTAERDPAAVEVALHALGDEAQLELLAAVAAEYAAPAIAHAVLKRASTRGTAAALGAVETPKPATREPTTDRAVSTVRQAAAAPAATVLETKSLSGLTVAVCRLLVADPVFARTAEFATHVEDALHNIATVARVRVDPARPDQAPPAAAQRQAVIETHNAAGDEAATDLSSGEPVVHSYRPERAVGDVATERPEKQVAERGLVEVDRRPPDVVSSELGGAFYLLSVLDRLDLPASADGPGEPGPDLTRWAVLALVLRAWRYEDDPLLTALETMENPREPGSSWTYRIPAWAGERLQLSGPLTWRTADQTVQMIDAPTQVVVADLPLVSHGQDRWAGHVATLIDLLLERAGVSRRIVETTATVAFDALEVLVTIPVDQIDIAVRRAGLDASPGWVPALGRSIEIEFS